jgi:hypothetical protein
MLPASSHIADPALVKPILATRDSVSSLAKHILHLFRTGLDTVDIVAWLRLHDGVRLTEAQVVRAMHRAIEAELKAKGAA